jgi:hypothetical protein
MAVERVGELMSSVERSQLDHPTPCSEWDVCGLLNHLLGGLEFTAGCMAGNPPNLRPTEADSSLVGQRNAAALGYGLPGPGGAAAATRRRTGRAE